MRLTGLLAILLMAAHLWAQDESKIGAEFRREGERLKEDCGGGFKGVGGCAVSLATEQPMHVALGSIAPQNGFGAGPAFVTHQTPNESWRLTWSGDFIVTPNSAWRAGGYVKLIHTNVAPPVVVTTPGAGSRPPTVTIRPYTVINLYAQAISLPTVSYFGLGPDTTKAQQTAFGLHQTIVGANTIFPVARLAGGLNLALLGEVNGRFVSVRSGESDTVPSIETIYNESTAPGLSTQPGFIQFGEGVRVRPSLGDGAVRLNYLAELQQFVATDSTYSFQRWTVDLGHEFPFYRRSSLGSPRDINTPNECASDVTSVKCPSVSRNRTGSVNVRFVISRSDTSDGSVVPFYFQQTLGGSDINGNRLLPSYEDYRFRAPNLLAVQETFEHSIFGPLGFYFAADQGRVEMPGGDAGDFLYSYSTGISLRAGGFPAVLFTYSNGGDEGHHVAFTISTSLLGGSSRPSLH